MLLANRYVFWGLILCLLLAFIGINLFDFSSIGAESKKEIVEKSFNNADQPLIVDLNEIENIRNIDQIDSETNQQAPSHIYKLKNNLFLIIYTIAIALLFVYREKQNRINSLLLEKQEDQIKMLEAKQKMPIQENLFEELKHYESILAPDLKLDTLEEKLHSEPKLLIAISRMVLEKIITAVYSRYTSEEATLNDMIVALHRNKKFNHEMNNYAHIIKGFGNSALHTNKTNPAVFNAKDAMLVLGILLQFIKELDKHNLIQDNTNA